MPITPLPSPGPDINDKATFPSRASAQAAAWPKLVDDINNAMLAFGPGSPFVPAASVGGTADAITLTTGLNLAALVDGQMVRWRAPAANTEAATINLDARGAKSALTVNGGALPTGYIRVGTGTDRVLTTAIYSATADAWIVGREVERGGNANGYYIRLADGTQFCNIRGVALGNIATAYGTVYRGTDYAWTFPAAFLGTSDLVTAAGADTNSAWANLNAGSATGATARAFAPVNTITGALGNLWAFGRWY